MSEKALYNELRRHTGKIVTWNRIESPQTASGFPDVCGTGNGKVKNQIELKFIGGGTKTLKKNFFRESQYMWFRQDLRHFHGDQGPFVLTKIEGWCFTIHRGQVILKLKDCKTTNEWVECSTLLFHIAAMDWNVVLACFHHDIL